MHAERFLRQSLDSVAKQNGIRCEIVVVDGGSCDDTVAIAKSFDGSIRVFVEPNLGQAAAINHGVHQADSPMILVLSGDDILYPGALADLVRRLDDYPELEVAYGEADFIDANGTHLGHYPRGRYEVTRFESGCFIPHAAALVRRDAFLDVGGLDESLDFAFDFDFWVRMSQRAAFQKIDRCLAAIRMHPDTKTLGKRRPAYREAFGVLKRYFGYIPYPWVFAYVNFLLDGGDQFFDPLRKKRRSMLLALPVGCFINFPKISRFACDWLSARRLGAFLRER